MTARHILITGGAGFIGSNLVKACADQDITVTLVDDFDDIRKWHNLLVNNIEAYFDWRDLEQKLPALPPLDCVVHLGANSSTTASNLADLVNRNINFSDMLWKYCARKQIPFLYASSAATYGAGENGFSDSLDFQAVSQLRPLNAYGWSKLMVDLMFMRRQKAGEVCPPHWYGLKFFNVYGPQEFHKDSMRSVACKMIEDIKAGKQTLTLFKSHNPNYQDGKQLRDFVYVRDCVDVMLWLARTLPESGIYNIGTGKAEAFLTKAQSVIAALRSDATIAFVDMPEAIREKYQYFTQADMSKLRSAGYNNDFHDVTRGIGDYVARWNQIIS